MLRLIYMWLLRTNHTNMLAAFRCSASTLTRWLHVLNCACMLHLQEQHVKIGGPGIIVEIDESKFGKRKYNVGHRVEGVERTVARRVFLIAVDDRSTATCVGIIRRYVEPGSIIYTDMWRGYNTAAIERLGMTHFTVNHSRYFVEPNTGVHTNTIEVTWNGVKQCIGKRYRTRDLITPHLAHFVWRRLHKNRLWEAILEAMQIVTVALQENNEIVDPIEQILSLPVVAAPVVVAAAPAPVDDSDSDSEEESGSIFQRFWC